MSNIAVCISSDDNYVQHMAATISSILKNKKSDEFIKIYIIDGGITPKNKEKLKFFEQIYDCKLIYVVPDLTKMTYCHVYRGDHISLAAYYRLMIPELIPQESTIIYLDCDIIVRKSLSTLYSMDFENNFILGVEDVSNMEHSKRLGLDFYINSGMLLMNCKLMREQAIVEKIFDWVEHNQQRIIYHDQDIINASLKGKIKEIDYNYNAQVRKNNLCKFDKLENPVILHFISSKKPWTLWKSLNSTHWSDEYFKALVNTPWQDFIWKYRIKHILLFPLLVFYPQGHIREISQWIFMAGSTPDHQFKIFRIFGFEFKIEKKKLLK